MKIISSLYWENLYNVNGEIFGNNNSTFSQNILEEIGNSKDILEVAVGYGRDTSFYINKLMVNSYLGVDVSKTAISMFNHTCREENIKLICDNYLAPLQIELLNNQYDVIVSHYFFHLLLSNERERALYYSKKLLKQNGKIIFSVFSKEDSKYGVGKSIEKDTFSCYLDKPEYHIYFSSKSSIENLAKTVGLKLASYTVYDEIEKLANKVVVSKSAIVILIK